jgi:hypothetical protein
LLAPLVTGLLAGCNDDAILTQIATTENATSSGYVYAISGTPPEMSAAYDMVTNSLVRPVVQSDGSVNFQIVFDIDDQGRVLLIPVQNIAPIPPAPVTGAPSVGIAKSATPYDLITKAALSGYVFDSVAYAAAGDTFYLELPQAGCVYGEPYYGKLAIDSVIVAERRLVVRAMTNRNCGGYRSLTAGLPTN